MDKQFDVIHSTRTNFLELIDSLSIEQLNKIPEGFSNNIAWNFGHMIISQQTLCYVRAGIQPRVEDSWFKKYQKGTKPEIFIDSKEIETLKGYLFSLIEDLKNDMRENKFKEYQKVMTSFGVELTSVEDAIPYFAMHDGLHFGYALAMKKLI